MDGARIRQLLTQGAHALSAPEDAAAQEGEAFAAEVRRAPCCLLPT